MYVPELRKYAEDTEEVVDNEGKLRRVTRSVNIPQLLLLNRLKNFMKNTNRKMLKDMLESKEKGRRPSQLLFHKNMLKLELDSTMSQSLIEFGN